MGRGDGAGAGLFETFRRTTDEDPSSHGGQTKLHTQQVMLERSVNRSYGFKFSVALMDLHHL